MSLKIKLLNLENLESEEKILRFGRGRPGVYHSWEDCLKQVKAYPDAKYKSFESLDEANDAYLSGYSYNFRSK